MAQNDLPSPSANNFTQRVRETLMVALGRTGDPLDRAITLRDLIDGGLAKVKSGFSLRSGMTGSLPITSNSVSEIDLTPPPTPTGFALSAAISHVFIEHDGPSYQQGHGHLRTHVYGVTHTVGQALPTFNDAVALGQFSGSIWAMPSNPATTWRLWIKWESVDGVLSVSPAGGTNGLEAVTGQDVSLLLAALTGEITAGQLYSDLGSRIDLIDGASSLVGSVNSRVLAEATARDTAIASSVEVVQARLNSGDFAAVKTSSSASADAIMGLKAEHTIKLDVAGLVSGYGLASSATSSEFGVRADRFYIAAPSVVQSTAPTVNLYDGFVWRDTSVTPNVTRYRSGTSWSITSPSIPFVVQTTPVIGTGTALNPEIPAGVYMADAYIKNGTITNAKIANLAVDDAKIYSLNAAKINAGFLSADRIEAGTLDAKIAYLDAAVITSGLISTARIGDASITSAKIANLAVDNAKIANLSAEKITAGYLNAARIQAGTINADMIISKSATSFSQHTSTCGNDAWTPISFYMDHYGYVSVQSNLNFTYSGTTASWSASVGIDSQSALAEQTGSYSNTAGPLSIGLMASTYLSAGWHTAYVKIYHSAATSNHMAFTAIFRSYR